MGVRLLVSVCAMICWITTGFAQSGNCMFKPPFFQLDFGRGVVEDFNLFSLTLYDRVASSCPTDGHYSYASSTSDCFRGDWHTLPTDHTPGDAEGNMLLVNSAYRQGAFFSTRVKGFKGSTTYEFGLWLMNVCRPTRKCPFPLLPNLVIKLQTKTGKPVAQFTTGEIQRVSSPHWTPHRAQFTMPSGETELVLTLVNTSPGGCGNDLVLDDITFRECVKEDPAKKVVAKKTTPVLPTPKPPVVKQKPKKETLVSTPASRKKDVVGVPQIEKVTPVQVQPQLVVQKRSVVPVPPVLEQRTNKLVRQIETTTGEVRLDLYDNGMIDGDTVSIYHNNVLVLSRQALAKKPISLRIKVDETQSVHELVMVAENLGSIPPNTSLMIVTTGEKRYEVFISSTEVTNAKVRITLKR